MITEPKELPEVKPDMPDVNLQTPAFGTEVFGMFHTVDTIPVATPKNMVDQIVTYVSGGTTRLYIYDRQNFTWRYTTLT